jgi:UDP:flavonoid glycosyltransferase YjiC (YdhE family)
VRILIASTTGVGHVNPLLPLALALRDTGHTVDWATGDEERAQLEGLGFLVHGIGLCGAERDERASALLPPDFLRLPPRSRRLFMFRAIFGMVAAAAAARDLAPLIDDDPPDLIVHESAEFASAAVATARGIPHATLGYGNALPPALVEAVAEAVSELWSDLGLVVPPDAGLYTHCYLHTWPARLAALPPVATALTMRPSFFAGNARPEPAWRAALGTERPLVCVSFTAAHTTIAPWRSTLEALASEDVDVVCAPISPMDAATLGPLPSNAGVEPSDPDLRLLGRASLLISNAPSEWLLMAGSVGIPQLVLPMVADQFDNADALTAAGAGFIIEPSDLSADAVHEAAIHLLEDRSFKSAAHTLAEEITAMPTPADRVANLEAVSIGRGR